MAEHHHQQYYDYNQNHPTNTHFQHQNEHSTSKILAVLTLFPISGVLFLLSGLILTGTLIGLTIATPIFFIFSPIIVPAMLVLALSVTGIITSGAFGFTALSSMAFIVNYFRRMSGGGSVQDQLDYAKRRAQDTSGYVGQMVKSMGQKTQELARA